MNNNQEKKDPKEVFDSLKFKNNINADDTYLRDRLNHYINNAISRADHYEIQRRIFLEINLTIMIVLATIVSIFFDSLNDNDLLKKIILIGIGIYFLFSTFNICYNLIEHKTKFNLIDKNKGRKQRIKEWFKSKFKSKKLDDFWITYRFYRGNIPKKRELKNSNELKESLITFSKKFVLKDEKESNNESNYNIKLELIKDDIRSLYIIFWHQANYHRLAKWTRRFTIWGIISIIFYIITVLIISFLVL